MQHFLRKLPHGNALVQHRYAAGSAALIIAAGLNGILIALVIAGARSGHLKRCARFTLAQHHREGITALIGDVDGDIPAGSGVGRQRQRDGITALGRNLIGCKGNAGLRIRQRGGKQRQDQQQHGDQRHSFHGVIPPHCCV